jgi:glycerol-3-phosphate dehydrogenase
LISRTTALGALADHEFDVVVIGGGITGAGVALDAASRGYSVALVEKADYAAGTSSRSSKLIHGGLRYLQSFDLGLVREALLERQLAVDRLVEREERDAPCRTHEIPLGLAIAPEELRDVPGVLEGSYGALADRYGHAAQDVLAIAAERPALAGPIVDGLPDPLAEAVHAARHEQARSVGDVLLRRTRLGLLAARELDGPDARVAAAIAPELGWDEDRTNREVQVFREEAAAEGIAPSG